MLFFDGFFMAWGMFLAIPCPRRRWNEEARSHMVYCLPLVGAIVGGLWVLLAWISQPLPAAVRALLLSLLPWCCTGFLHLDGFMDVCDAILSRRDRETRQRILKDSHCGAFAVICMVLLALAQWSFFLSADTVSLLPLGLIPVVTRICAALAVQMLPPMGTSQYAAMKRRSRVGEVCLFALLGVLIVIAAVLCGLPGLAPLAAAAVCWIAVGCGISQLGGMSGDVSGFALTLGELAGVCVVCLVG